VSTACIAYGATGSGKTHTMMGTREDRGMCARAAEVLLGLGDGGGARPTGDATRTLRMSFLEIYNETITDLLVDSAGEGSVRMDATLFFFFVIFFIHLILNFFTPMSRIFFQPATARGSGAGCICAGAL
jgi:hypothetical protein